MELQQAGVKPTDVKSDLIEDFKNGWQDWYLLSANNPHHWEYSTRKLNDPKWQGAEGQQLLLELQSEKDNELIVVLTTNFFRPYRGPSREYLAKVPLRGGKLVTAALNVSDFKTLKGELLPSWSQVDLLSLRAYFEKDGTLMGSKSWQGPQPSFKQLSWSSPDDRI